MLLRLCCLALERKQLISCGGLVVTTPILWGQEPNPRCQEWGLWKGIRSWTETLSLGKIPEALHALSPEIRVRRCCLWASGLISTSVSSSKGAHMHARSIGECWGGRMSLVTLHHEWNYFYFVFLPERYTSICFFCTGKISYNTEVYFQVPCEAEAWDVARIINHHTSIQINLF